MRIDDINELHASTYEPGKWSWWALVPFFSNDGTTPMIWAIFSYPGWMPIFISLFNDCHEFWAAFQLSRTVVEFIFVIVALLLLFGYFRELPLSSYRPGLMLWAGFSGRPEPWLSYFSNVPDLSCKDHSGGYWFICLFLARVRMTISQQSELEKW